MTTIRLSTIIPLALVLLLPACSLLFPPAYPPLVEVEAEAAPITVFQNVRVFSGPTTETVAARDVWLGGSEITYVGPTGERKIPDEAKVVAGEGLTLLPGYVDIHVHALSGGSPPWKLATPDVERNLEAFLYAGITTVLDLGGELDESVDLRRRVAAGELPGPRLLVAGPHFTAHGGHPIAMVRALLPWYLGFLAKTMGYEVDGREEADGYLELVLAADVDAVKITSDEIPLGIPRITTQTAAYVARRAQQAGKPVFAHVGFNDDAWRMAAAGADVFAHNVYQEELTAATAAMIVERGIPVVVTLAPFDTVDRLVHGDYELDAMQRAVGEPHVVEALLNRPDDYAPPTGFGTFLERLRAHRDVRARNAAVLRDHGVTVLVGSDAPTVGQFAGAALHREFALLVEAGFSPGEVLHAVTYLNAETLGLAEEIGSLEVGRKADLVLVEGDPTVDIRNAGRIAAVYQSGRRVHRTDSIGNE